MSEKIMREKQITRTSLIGVLTNVLLAAFKALAGMLSGSIAIVLDAVNDLTDAMSSIITIAGIKLAKRKPDAKHPFGYGRIEYFSAIIIAGLVIFAGLLSIRESVEKIIHPEMPDYTAVTLLIICVAIVTKLLLGRFVKGQGEKYNSDALIASGSDASFDAIISASTLVSAAVAFIFKFSVDGIVGAIISCFIIKAGVEMFMESIGHVIGSRPDSEITTAIKSTVRSIDPVIGAYDLVMHNYGPDSAIGTIHVEIPADMTAEQLHKLTKKIQQTIIEQFHVFLTVGIYAVDEKHAPVRQAIREIALKHQGVLGTHGVYIDEESKYSSFDVLTDFTAMNKKELAEQLTEEITAELLKGYTIDISFDTNYSD